jgi:hypothetical protein
MAEKEPQDPQVKESVAKARRLDRLLNEWKDELDKREQDFLRIKYDVK